MRRLGARRERGWAAAILGALALLAFLPLAVQRDDVLNFVFVTLLSITLAQSWNVVAGYAGQVNLGHAAFFGLGALTARTLWIGGTPLAPALAAGALVATAFALLIGVAAFRLRGAYFAIGTLALGEILRTTVSNVLPEISTLPTAAIATYRLSQRYYLALALAALSVVTVALLSASRLGLGMQALREDEEAAEAAGVGALRLKLTALALSTALAGLAGGLFAYYHISYYPSHAFSPSWTFDALLMTFIGGVGTLHGPVLGAVLYVFLKEYLALRWVDFHLLIFGALFVVIVLLLPGGLVQAAARARRLLARPPQRLALAPAVALAQVPRVQFDHQREGFQRQFQLQLAHLLLGPRRRLHLAVEGLPLGLRPLPLPARFAVQRRPRQLHSGEPFHHRAGLRHGQLAHRQRRHLLHAGRVARRVGQSQRGIRGKTP